MSCLEFKEVFKTQSNILHGDFCEKSEQLKAPSEVIDLVFKMLLEETFREKVSTVNSQLQ